jgi:hypothetical protein
MALPPRKPGSSGLSRGIGPGSSRTPAARGSGLNRGVPSAPAGGNFAAPPGPPPPAPQGDHQIFVNNDPAGSPGPATRPGAGQSGLRARSSGIRAGVSGPRPGVAPTGARTSGLRSGVGAGEASSRSKRPARRVSTGRSESDSIFSNIGLRIGVVVFIALIGAAVKYSKGTSADWKYYEKAGDLFHSGIGFDTATSLKEKMNRLPHSNVSDPMLKEFHNTFIEMLTLVEKDPDNGPPNPRIKELNKRLVELAEKLDQKYGGK